MLFNSNSIEYSWICIWYAVAFQPLQCLQNYNCSQSGRVYIRSRRVDPVAFSYAFTLKCSRRRIHFYGPCLCSANMIPYELTCISCSTFNRIAHQDSEVRYQVCSQTDFLSRKCRVNSKGIVGNYSCEMFLASSFFFAAFWLYSGPNSLQFPKVRYSLWRNFKILHRKLVLES